MIKTAKKNYEIICGQVCTKSVLRNLSRYVDGVLYSICICGVSRVQFHICFKWINSVKSSKGHR